MLSYCLAARTCSFLSVPGGSVPLSRYLSASRRTCSCMRQLSHPCARLVSVRMFDPCASRAIAAPAAPCSWAVDAALRRDGQDGAAISQYRRARSAISAPVLPGHAASRCTAASAASHRCCRVPAPAERSTLQGCAAVRPLRHRRSIRRSRCTAASAAGHRHCRGDPSRVVARDAAELAS